MTQPSRYDTASSASSRTPGNETVTTTGNPSLTSTSPSTRTRTTSPTTVVTSPSTVNQTETQNILENINTQNMTPESLAALETLIQVLSTGGTPQQQAEIERKARTQTLIEELLGQYSSGRAFSDASGLMSLNLKQALEKNMPAIQRATEGAGTSAGSAQGLLSQNMSRDAALAASALGAEQARSYAGATAAISGQLADLAGSALDPVTTALLSALGVAKGATSSTQRTMNTTGSRNTLNSGSTQTTSGGTIVEDTSGTSTTSMPGASTQTSIFSPADYTGMGGGRTDAATILANALSPTYRPAASTELDPNVYYSQFGQSGGGQSLYGFLRG